MLKVYLDRIPGICRTCDAVNSFHFFQLFLKRSEELVPKNKDLT